MKATLPALALALVLAVAHSSPAQIEDLEQTRAALDTHDYNDSTRCFCCQHGRIRKVPGKIATPV